MNRRLPRHLSAQEIAELELAGLPTHRSNIERRAAREGWKFDEIHTEEGRLDEVFRAITLPDTVRAAA